jgi:uncharacterized membrane protein SpoIIM required for sporulation
MMSLLRRIIVGVTGESIYRRIGWMYGSFFLLYLPVTAVSYFLLPEGILRGKHPIISRLRFSPNVWVSTLQVFGYNLIPTTLIIASNLLAQRSRLVKERFVPIGYTAFWGLTVLFAVITGSWSFDVVATSPPLLCRLVRVFDILHHSGLLEFSGYLLAAVVSFKFTLWYSDRKTIVGRREYRSVRLTKPEKVLLVFASVLLFCGAYIESRSIIQLTG